MLHKTSTTQQKSTGMNSFEGEKMSKKPHSIFTIKVNGEEKELFKIHLKKDGNVVLSMERAENYRSAGQTEGNHSIQQQKYSVHKSEKSANGINVIKHEFIIDDAEYSYPQYHYTKAIKNGFNFAPIVFKRCPDIALEKYAFDSSLLTLTNTQISLGEFDTSQTTLFYAIGVANKNYHFDLENNGLIFHTNIEVGDFNFVVIWSFIPLTSAPHGFLEHIFTTEETKHVIEEGWNNGEYLKQFKGAYARTQIELFSTILSQFPEDSSVFQMVISLLSEGKIFTGKTQAN